MDLWTIRKKNLILQRLMLEIKEFISKKLKGEVILPASKSISNRYLLIEALQGSGNRVNNLSDSNDVRLMQKALGIQAGEVDFEDAGTPMRLYLAYAALKGLDVTIDGDERLRARPIAALLIALEQLGAVFEYAQKKHALPLTVKHGIDKKKEEVSIDMGLSSQFLSALLLIAPYFEHGLLIKAKGRMNSIPYIDLTLGSMKLSGAKVVAVSNGYKVAAGSYRIPEHTTVEPDWSAATFIYALAAMADDVNLILRDLSLNSIQGDKKTAEVFKHLGVMSTQENSGIRLSKTRPATELLRVDFSDMPDMFPAVAAVCAAIRVPALFTRTDNLSLKESDRVEAMRINLMQTGAHLVKTENGLEFRFLQDKKAKYLFRSFNDHRIAMACSIFAFHTDIVIDDETVVKKSYPGYWSTYKALRDST
jgi:3-phosphoshikimate 1-carboxyvinyltransferase